MNGLLNIFVLQYELSMLLDTFKEQIRGILNKYPISKAAVFGSFARGEETKNSDIDLLIEPSKPISLFLILKIERELGLITNRKIDIVEYSAIKRSIKNNILSEAIPIL
jgi:predicted nucleotidyltransferase